MSKTSTKTHTPQAWTLVLVFFSITSLVEAIGLSQVFAFMPLYLQQLGLPQADVPRWTGTLSALAFVFGLPLVPFWGVWADRYSRKAVIIRSSLVEAVVFALIALSREPWQLAASFVLSGFQLGNSGVMLAALRDITPLKRIGISLAIFGATWPVGSAIGPAVGGLMVDGFGAHLWSVFAVSSLLSAAVAALLAAGFREVRPQTFPSGRMLELAYGAVRGIFADPATRRLFTIYGIAFLARQMASPFLPIVVQNAHGGGSGLASSIALVVGTAALVGGLISPLGGAVGDRIGFRSVLIFSMAGSGLALLLMPFVPGVAWLALDNVVLAALTAAIGTMVFALLALEVSSERRSATLNLVYLPLYLSGIVGPAIGAVVVGAGVAAVFVLGGLTFGAGALFAAVRERAATQ